MAKKSPLSRLGNLFKASDDNENLSAGPLVAPARKAALAEKPANRATLKGVRAAHADPHDLVYVSNPPPFKKNRYTPTLKEREFPYLLSPKENPGEAGADHRKGQDRVQGGLPYLYSVEKREEECDDYTPHATDDYEAGYGTGGDSSPPTDPFASPEDRIVSGEAREGFSSLYPIERKKKKTRDYKPLATPDYETGYGAGGDPSPPTDPFASPEDRIISEEDREGFPSPYSIKKKERGGSGYEPLATANYEMGYGSCEDPSPSMDPFASLEDSIVSHEAESGEEELFTSPVAHSTPKKKVWPQPGQYSSRRQRGRPANLEKDQQRVPTKVILGGTLGAKNGMMRDGSSDGDIDELQMDLPGTRINVKRQ